MKIGVKVNLFNYKLRNRRTEKGYTQAQMAMFLDIHQTIYSEIELLRKPRLVAEKLENTFIQIGDILETPLDDLFPPEYLRMIEKNPVTAFYFVKDVDLDSLPSGVASLLSLPDMEESVEIDQMKKLIMDSLNLLKPRERQILEFRYGFVGEPMTFEETGVKFGVTKERIRQIEAEAISKLRHPTICKKLSVYL